MADPTGAIVHAEIRIGDAIVMAFDAPAGTQPQPAFIRLYVPEARFAFARRRSGRRHRGDQGPTLLAFGDRVARVRDPLGNIWWLQQRTSRTSQRRNCNAAGPTRPGRRRWPTSRKARWPTR